MSHKKQYLIYDGSNFFRMRIVLSCLSGKPIKNQNIRHKDEDPGIRDFEVSFIRLIDQISNGCKITVSESGTEVTFIPGILCGGRIEHTCPNSRSIGYFLEPLFLLAPFCKKPLDITFRGVTNNKSDPSIDMIRYSMMPVIKRFILKADELVLTMQKRGLPPTGGGIVHFKCPPVRTLRAFQWEEMGKVKKIRGTAFTSRVAPIVANRIIDEVRNFFKTYLTDVYFTCDSQKGSSPGYGICMNAETNKGSVLTTELLKCREETSDQVNERLNESAGVPEDFGRQAAFALCQEIYNGGVVDSMSQSLILSYMVLAPKDVSKVVLGKLTPYTMAYMRHLKEFFGVIFKIDAYDPPADELNENSEKNSKNSEKNSKNSEIDNENNCDSEDLRLGGEKLLLTCVGVGYSNISKPQI